mgnify:FL=1
MFLILTQIDQVKSEQLEEVKQQIKKQLPELTMICISAQRYSQGVSESKPKFVELSAMDSLFTLVAGHLSKLNILRKQESRRLVSKIRIELNESKEFLQKELVTADFERENQQNHLENDSVLFIQNIQTRKEG